MDVKFTEWLEEQMTQQQMSMRELARRGKISHTSVSNVLGGRTDPTADFCLGVAKALRLKPDYVLRKAGHLPPVADEGDPALQEAMVLFEQLHTQDQERVLLFMRALEEAQELREQTAQSKSAPTTGLAKAQPLH